MKENRMGGKSRKMGSVSLKLVQRLKQKRDQQSKKPARAAALPLLQLEEDDDAQTTEPGDGD